MPAISAALSAADTLTPSSPDELAAAVAEAHAARAAIYPVGGGTSLDFGLPAKAPGRALSLAGLGRVIDYPARDLTVTVEAGITLAKLDAHLAAEGQWLPIEAPHADRATLGGLVATAWCGPRRFGWGRLRDYVIGISAVDGRGLPFKGGGRVVKNVAGYDFCKLLTGSLGTLGVITQVTLRTKPRPAHSAIVACRLNNWAGDWSAAEQLLAGLITSAVTPAAIELVVGPAWKTILPSPPGSQSPAGLLLVGLDGSPDEVAWMVDRLLADRLQAGIGQSEVVNPEQTAGLYRRLVGFAAGIETADSPLVIKANVRPGAVVDFVRLALEVDPGASIQAHAGSGIVIVRFAEFPSAAVSRQLVGRLQPAAVAGGGRAIVLSSAYSGELTRQAVWGGATPADDWMRKVKDAFDPDHLLNPGRFVY